MVAYNQGKVRTTQYFGHLPGEQCRNGFESAIHLAGKQVILQAKWLNLPALEVYAEGIVPRLYKPLHVRVVEPATAAVYQTVVAEVAHEVAEPKPSSSHQADLFSASLATPRTYTLRADLMAHRASEVDWLEIRVTHAVDERKRRLLQHAGHRVIEIDLSGLVRTGITLDDVKWAVLDTVETKTWLAHPAVPEAAAALRRELERESEQAAAREMLWQQPGARRPRQWLGDGEVRAPIVLPPPPSPPTDGRRLDELRTQLGLSPTAHWPRYLDLDLPGNGGSLVAPRIWLSRLYLDWVHGRRGARYLRSDLEASVAAKFGVKPRWGHRDLRQALERRVLPYWAACGLVTVAGEVVVVVHQGPCKMR